MYVNTAQPIIKVEIDADAHVSRLLGQNDIKGAIAFCDEMFNFFLEHASHYETRAKKIQEKCLHEHQYTRVIDLTKGSGKEMVLESLCAVCGRRKTESVKDAMDNPWHEAMEKKLFNKKLFNKK